jgi:large subunit ribosomal protein L24
MRHIKKNDKVTVLSGKERGRQGKVVRVFPDKEAALVEKLNMIKRHTRAGGKAGQQGGIIEKEAPIKLSKLMLVCPHCSKPTRTGVETLDDKARVRYCKKCRERVD